MKFISGGMEAISTSTWIPVLVLYRTGPTFHNHSPVRHSLETSASDQIRICMFLILEKLDVSTILQVVLLIRPMLVLPKVPFPLEPIQRFMSIIKTALFTPVTPTCKHSSGKN